MKIRFFIISILALFCLNYNVFSQEWYPIHVDLGNWDGDLRDVKFPLGESQYGWIVGDGGMVLNTRDGGASWVKQSVPTDKNLNSVFFLDRFNGWAVGDEGAMIRTRDGSSWSIYQSPIPGIRLNGLYFTDQNNGWAVGNLGTIIHWNGSTWISQTSGTGQHLYAVWFIDNNEGWAAGDGGTILHTNNGGLIWEKITSGTESVLFGMFFADSQNGWIVGDEGVIIHRHRNGLERQTSNVRSTLYDVDFVSATTGWIAGGNRELLGTTNGGSSWQTGYIPFAESAVFGIDFTAPDSAIAVGKSGNIIRYTASLPKLEIELVSPTGNINTLNPEFVWKTTRPDLVYILYISRGSEPFSNQNQLVFLPISVGGSTSYKLPQDFSLPHGTYSWGIEAEDGTRAKPFQSLQFTTWPETEIVLIGPSGYIKEPKPTFEWHWTDSAEYTLFIDTDGNPYDGRSIKVGKVSKYKIADSDPVSPLIDGRYSWGVRGVDEDKTIESAVMTFTVDLSPPVGTIVINGGAKATNSLKVNLSLNASDPLTASDPAGIGVAQMQLSNNGSTWSEPAIFTGSATLSYDMSEYGGDSKDGLKTVYVRYKDALDHWSEPVKAQIIFDTKPPTGTILIEKGAEITGSKTVTLSLSASDDGSGMLQGGMMQLRNDNGNWSDPLVYESNRGWDLTAYGSNDNEGIRTVYVKYRDVAGNWMTQTPSDSIKLDKTGPKGSIIINDNALETNLLIVKLSVSASDESGVDKMQFTNGSGNWSPLEPYEPLKDNWDLSQYGGNANDGVKTVYARFVDSVGNITQPSVEDSIVFKSFVKITELQISTKIPGKVKNGDTVQVNGKTESGLELITKELLDENGKPITQDLSGIIYESEIGTIKGSFILAKTSAKSVKLRIIVKDKLGNSSEAISNILTVDNTPPTNMSVTIDQKKSDGLPINSTFISVSLSAEGAKEIYVDGDIDTVYEITNGLRNWIPYVKALKMKLKDGDGIKEVKVKFRDDLGNTSPDFSDKVSLDMTKPTGTIKTDAITSSFVISLKLSATDKSGVESYQLSNDNSNWTDVLPFDAIAKEQNAEAVQSYDLRKFGGSATDGTHKVYVKFKDKAGNWSDPISSTIEVDSTPPSISHFTLADNQEETKPVSITAIIKDNRALTQANLYYRRKGSVEYKEMPLQKISGDYYTALIPGVDVTAMGVEYYLSASDGLQASTSPSPASPYSLNVVDSIAPSIQHEPIKSLPVKSPLKITAKVTDAVKVEKVSLYYRVNTETDFKKIDMSETSGEYSASISTLNLPGVIRYYIEATDTAKNVGRLPERGAKDPYIVSFVDVDPPIITHTPVPNNQEAGKPVTIGATITDNVAVDKVIFKYKTSDKLELIEIKMTNVGSYYRADIPAEAVIPGNIEYTITASDASAQSDDAKVSRSFTVIDTTAPRIEVTLAPSRIEVNKDISIQANVTDNVKVSVVTLYYKNVGDTKFSKVDMRYTGKYAATIPGQRQTGEVKYYIYAIDSYNNASTIPSVDPENFPSAIAVFDSSTPVIQHSPIASTQEAGVAVAISAIITDDVQVADVTLHYRSASQSSFKIASMIETGTKSLYSGSIPAGDVNPAGVEYYIKATDNSANVTTHPAVNPDRLPHSFLVVDTMPPEITHFPLQSVLITDPIAIKAKVTDLTGIKEVKVFYKLEGNDFKSLLCTYDGNNEFSAIIPSPLLEGNIEYYIQAEDNSGNINTSQSYKLFVDDPFPPLPPTKLTAASSSGGKIKLTWELSKSPDVGKYNIYTDSGSGNVDYSKIYDSVDSTKNSWESTSLGEGIYRFSVRAVDKSGNEEDNTVVVAAEADAKKPDPVTNLSAKSISGGRIELNWSLSLSKDVKIYNIYWDNAEANIDFSSALARVNDPATRWVSDKLSDGVVYRFVVRSQDNAGNEEQNSNIVSARADAIPPGNVTGLTSITHKTDTWSNQSKITVNWNPADDAISGLAGYSVSWDNEGKSSPDEVMDINSSVTQMTYDAADGSFYFHIRPVDKSGNWSNTLSHIGPFMIDTQAPEPPTKIASRPIAGGRLEVSWNPSVSDDVAKYNIYWDNGTGEGVSYSKPIATVTANSYQSSELQDGRNYEFSVRAEDRAGNEEKNTITSTSVPDNQPPTISHKPIIALLEQEIMTVTVYANVDDSSGLGKVKVHYRKHGDQQYLDRDMSNDGGNLYKGEIPSSVFSSAGVDYYISAMDLAGNTATTEVTKIAIVKSLQIAIDPSKENEITLGDGSSLYFPAGSVPLDTHLNISIPKIIPEPQSGLKRHILSREFSLDKELLKPINITLKYNDSNIIGEDESRLCMYLWDGKRWNYMANVDAQDNSATVSTMKWGIFSIIGDYEAPIIEELAPSEYAIPDSRITARIKDNGSGVIWKNIEIKLNGSKIEVPEASLREVNLSVAIPQKLTNGKYSLIIVVKDNAGNQSISESRFDVTGRLNLMNVYCYPNPFSPSIGTNFAYTLTESANEVNIRIFGMDGKLVRKIEGTIAVGKNIVSWSGDDELGDTVLNSVYICYIEVKGSRETVAETIKIAGWDK